ncbi:unnamed protein product [Penicillium salamii]|nr:unnamed protein product [Penicillium salamii]
MRFSWISLLPAVTAISVQSIEDLLARQLPNPATGVKTIKTANNVTIRYKEPGKEGVCETTPGVKSYSGYVDLSPTEHTFFWFFEARHDPENAPITLWLNGGPGSDSLIGLFEELGPCRVNKENETYINKHSWNEVSNMLFLSQPLGVGFSYAEKGAGTLNPITGSFENSDVAGVDGRYPIINATAIDTTELAAKATWEVLQGFLGGLPKLDTKIKSKSFNLWTESYGGHYGPASSSSTTSTEKTRRLPTALKRASSWTSTPWASSTESSMKESRLHTTPNSQSTTPMALRLSTTRSITT